MPDPRSDRLRSNPIVQVVIARGASLLPTAVGTLVATRITLDHYDEGSFNAYILAYSLMALLPLNTLGAGTAVVTTIAEHGVEAEHSQRVLLTAVRVMTLSAIALTVGSLAISALGLWPQLLGDGTWAGASVGFGLVVFAVTFVPGLGQSVLLGVNRSHLTVTIQAFVAPAMALGVYVCARLDAPPDALVLVPSIALLALTLVNALVSARVTKVRWRTILARVPRRRRYPGALIRSMAGPALIISVIAPVAVEADRLVLSHVSTEAALTNYSLAVQIFAPVLTVVFAAAQPLWPTFARARAAATRPPSMVLLTIAFAVFGILSAALVVAFIDPLTRIVGGSGIDLGLAVPILMAALVAGQALALPLSMALRDAEGLRLQAIVTTIGVPTNLALSIVLASHLGAPGPILATLLIGTPIQAIPMTVHYRRRRRRERAAEGGGEAEAIAGAAGPAVAPSDVGAANLLPRLPVAEALAPGSWIDPGLLAERRRRQSPGGGRSLP
jgi:O-antigen/teichoic acid export membrane protein